MTVKQLSEKCLVNKGIKILPLTIVQEEYFKICKMYNWTPSHEGLIEYDRLLNTAINLRRV